MNTMKYFKLAGVAILLLILGLFSCENELDLPEAGSIEDLTPPSADFTFSGGETVDDFTEFQFANLSVGATSYVWSFGDGTTSTEFEPTHTFPDEGTYTITLEVMDNLGVTSSLEQTLELVMPIPPAAPNPILVNADFDELPKSSGSDCACSGWINKDIGQQGETSSGNGSSVVKFDNLEPDHVYQEFEVVPNIDYTMQIPIAFQSNQGNGMPSSLEIRVLAGSGYVDGYVPVIFTDTAIMPQQDWGYTTVAQVENPDNNLMVEVIDSPGVTDYITYTFAFNSGINESVALFIRGIGGPDGGEFNYNSGDEEIRADSVTIIAN